MQRLIVEIKFTFLTFDRVYKTRLILQFQHQRACEINVMSIQLYSQTQVAMHFRGPSTGLDSSQTGAENLDNNFYVIFDCYNYFFSGGKTGDQDLPPTKFDIFLIFTQKVILLLLTRALLQCIVVLSRISIDCHVITVS